MAFYCTVMLDIALELACHDSAYVGLASKFLDHFVAISDAMEGIGGKDEGGLWNEEDGFYYDHIGSVGRHRNVVVELIIIIILRDTTEVIAIPL